MKLVSKFPSGGCAAEHRLSKAVKHSLEPCHSLFQTGKSVFESLEPLCCTLLRLLEPLFEPIESSLDSLKSPLSTD